MSPGAVGYLDDLAVWAAWWFCFDARLRALPEVADAGALGWWRDHWPAVVGLLAVALTTLHILVV